MAAKRQAKAISAPLELTQEQVEMARKGYSERVFAALDKASRPGKRRSKAKSSRRASSKK
jgi:hypothetical protein